MSKEMSALKFYFRNGENWTITRENIGDLWIRQITSSFGRINGGEFQKINPCEGIKIEIFEEADHVSTDDINQGGLESGMFGRALQYEDIEKMGIVFNDQSEDLVYFPYKDKKTQELEGLDNAYQSTKIGKNGHLYIVIDPHHTVTTMYGEDI